MTDVTDVIDITPTPRILRTLGDIPFEVWQCLAELSDNSLDAFRDAAKAGKPIQDARLDIVWSREDTPNKDREICIKDNGPGMPLSVLQNAARAGYSSNDPVNNLGLFGMGFNIATARLGEETIFLSATKDAKEWTGIVINFTELIERKSFAARVVQESKENPDDCGTKIVIKRLRDGVYSDLKSKETVIRRRLETIYSDILDKKDVEIRLQGKGLRPIKHCVWGASRFVTHKGSRVMAVQEIDIDLGEALFDTAKNRYLSELEAGDVKADDKTIIKRPRRLKGWVGIQRYFSTTEFGLDFIRNGRKILIGDKTLFSFENPDTGTRVIEYPIELATTIGGRIVGELHVDYLIPTYQKNGFDTSNLAWKKTVDALRGAGPILPKQRNALGYSGDNESPLGKLINAFRRPDPGTKCLALRRDVAQTLLADFRKGVPEFQNDDKWYKALQEEDKARGKESDDSPAVDAGEVPSDDLDIYSPIDPVIVAPTPQQTAQPIVLSSEKGDLMGRSEKLVGLSGKYTYLASKPPFEITAWKLKSGQIQNNGERVPCISFQDGIEVDFFFDETHTLLEEYPLTPKQLLLQNLAQRFAGRDSTPLQETYWGLIYNHLADERINLNSLRERADSKIREIRDGLPAMLAHRLNKCLELIKSNPVESNVLSQILIEEAPDLFSSFQDGTQEAAKVLAYVSEDTLISFVTNMPEEFLDGKVFKLPYQQIVHEDQATVDRLRRMSVDKITSYLKDAKTLLKSTGKPNKAELIRYSNTLRVLEDRIA